MSTNDGAAHVTATVPWQTRAADPNAIGKSDWFWERGRA